MPANESLWGVGLPLAAACGALAYVVCVSVYRLYLSPLARFPGPRAAAWTLWYEFWYDVVRRGQYTFEIQKMHDRYGPIVRISPHELHINDPEFIPVVYAGGTKRRDKYHWATKIFGGAEAAIATVGHEAHRMRRAPMNRFFSKESVRRLEPVLRERLGKLLAKLEERQGAGGVLNVNLLFSAFTSDVIMEYAFANAHDYLDAPDFDAAFFEMMASVHEMSALAKQYGFVLPLLDALPEAVVARMDRGMSLFGQFRREMVAQIRRIMDRRRDGTREGKGGRPTIFHDILDSSLPEREKTVARLWQEAQVIVVAGTETTAWTLSVVTFHLLSDPERMRRLKEELDEALPDASTTVRGTDLERLPYLTAVIQEGLRLSFGVSTRLQRVCPDEAVTCQGWVIPPGTPMGMSASLIHLNPDVFPSPHEFIPERWLEHPRLDRYLCSFSKGSRQCLGINLAYAELYLCLAHVFRRYGSAAHPGFKGHFELFETTRDDVEFHYDLFVPFPKKDSKGIRIVLR